MRSAAYKQFVETVVHPIPGFLEDFAAICTIELLEFQDEIGVGGSFLEIGVYGGRYMSVLARSAAKTGSHVVGIDPFFSFTAEQVRANLQPAMRIDGESRGKLTLLKDVTVNVMPETLLSLLGSRTRFVDVDGSHERADVLWDLRLAEAVIGPGGILTVDDFVNPYDIGVNEAFYQFFLQPRALAPFAYVANKLFLTTARHCDQYRHRLEIFLKEDTVFDRSARFRSRLEQPGAGRRMVETQLLGRDVLIIP